MAKETIIDTDLQMVKTTFSTKCIGVKTELTIDFDFSNLTLEQVYELALRSAIIDFQRTIRDLRPEEAIAKHDGQVVTVGEKRKRVESLSVKAMRKHQKGEELTKEETQALIAALQALQKKQEEQDDFIITKD